jgi:hypothetical protein
MRFCAPASGIMPSPIKIIMVVAQSVATQSNAAFSQPIASGAQFCAYQAGKTAPAGITKVSRLLNQACVRSQYQVAMQGFGHLSSFCVHGFARLFACFLVSQKPSNQDMACINGIV